MRRKFVGLLALLPLALVISQASFCMLCFTDLTHVDFVDFDDIYLC